MSRPARSVLEKANFPESRQRGKSDDEDEMKTVKITIPTTCIAEL